MHPFSFRVGLAAALAVAAADVRAEGDVWIGQVSMPAKVSVPTKAPSHERTGRAAADWSSLAGGSSSSQTSARSGDANWESISLNSVPRQVSGETSGSNNSLTVRQDGLSHTLRVVQTDTGNTMVLTQTGEGQTLTALQSGQQNAMNLQQGGSGNVLTAVQSGTMNTMGIVQTGSGNRTVIVQR